AYGQRDHVPIVLLWLRDQQMLGQKTGAGFYKYEGKTQRPNNSLVKWQRGLHGEPEGAEGPNIPPDKHRDPRVRFNEEKLTHRLGLFIGDEGARFLGERGVEFSEEWGFRIN